MASGDENSQLRAELAALRAEVDFVKAELRSRPLGLGRRLRGGSELTQTIHNPSALGGSEPEAGGGLSRTVAAP